MSGRTSPTRRVPPRRVPSPGAKAPAKAPKVGLKRFNAELNRVLKLPAVREKLAAQGIEAVGSTPDDSVCIETVLTAPL